MGHHDTQVDCAKMAEDFNRSGGIRVPAWPYWTNLGSPTPVPGGAAQMIDIPTPVPTPVPIPVFDKNVYAGEIHFQFASS
jgi:hypothetical protein